MGPDAVHLDSLGPVLLERLRSELSSPALAYRVPPKVMRGGKFSAVYTFEVDPPPPGWTGSFVLRLLNHPEQARLEAGLHAAATADGLRAPRLLMWEADASKLGFSYLIVERVPGRTYLRGVEPSRFTLDLPKLLAAWPQQLPRIINALAGVDVEATQRALTDHGVPDGFTRAGRHLRAVESASANEPTLAGVIEWLHDNRPSTPKRPALVHGDLWPANVFIQADGIVLIDWTRGGIDDPALDVGFAKVAFALMPEPFPPPSPIRQLVHLAGSSIAARISANCDQLVGGRERVRYYEALRCAVELTEIVSERSAGKRSNWEHGVPALVRHLQDITGLSIPFI